MSILAVCIVLLIVLEVSQLLNGFARHTCSHQNRGGGDVCVTRVLVTMDDGDDVLTCTTVAQVYNERACVAVPETMDCYLTYADSFFASTNAYCATSPADGLFTRTTERIAWRIVLTLAYATIWFLPRRAVAA